MVNRFLNKLTSTLNLKHIVVINGRTKAITISWNDITPPKPSFDNRWGWGGLIGLKIGGTLYIKDQLDWDDKYPLTYTVRSVRGTGQVIITNNAVSPITQNIWSYEGISIVVTAYDKKGNKYAEGQYDLPGSVPPSPAPPGGGGGGGGSGGIHFQ